MPYRTLRRLLLIGCLLGAGASWWFSCLVHTSVIVSTPAFSVQGMARAGGVSLVSLAKESSRWRFHFRRWPVEQVVWYAPAWRFQAGRTLTDEDWFLPDPYWHLGVPLWFPWFLLGGGAWLFLRRVERRTIKRVEMAAAGKDAVEKPGPDPA